MQVFATRWRFSSLFRHQMAFFKEKSRIMQVFATRGRFFFLKCKILPPEGVFFFLKKCIFLPPDGALVQILTTRWRFFKKNRFSSLFCHQRAFFFFEKMQLFAARWRFSSDFDHQMALF